MFFNSWYRNLLQFENVGHELSLEEQDTSSDIEQHQPFGNLK